MDLADRLCVLVNGSRVNLGSPSRELGISLLKDWVFTQSPRATKEVIDDIFDDFGLRWAAWRLGRGRSGIGDRSPGELSLGAGAGAEELVAKIWTSLGASRPYVVQRDLELARIAAQQMPQEPLSVRWWQGWHDQPIESRARW